MKKQSIKSFNFIKTICALGIVIFHFSGKLTKYSFRPLYEFVNGDWGAVFVAIFFMVSGALLYYNYSDKLNIKNYYIKRWKSIFPMFYITYLFFEIQYMFINGSILYRKNLYPYIYTILGLDGYLSSIIPTYYIIGEWFLGMIIILYILFPIILYFFKKNDKLTFIVFLILYIIFLDKPIINPAPYWSITSSLISFITGMLIIKNKNFFLNKYGFIISLVGIIILYYIKLPISTDIGNHLFGLFTFIFLYIIGKYIMKNNICDIIFTNLSKITYATFLLQHITVDTILKIWFPKTTIDVITLLILTMLFVICEAKLLTDITNFTINKLSKNEIANKKRT